MRILLDGTANSAFFLRSSPLNNDGGCPLFTGKQLLTIAGILSFTVALLHVAIILVGAPAYRYFGAGEELATLAASGSAFPAMLTLVLVANFALFGLYAFSGAGLMPRLPLLRTALALIGTIYTARGLAAFHQVFQLMTSSALIETREVVFSLVSLGIGIVYLAGTVSSWNRLRAISRLHRW